jgi:RimJ/RimL family protein N-acetyltransferase
MPGPAFKVGDRVSLHPIEPEDHEFLQRGRNHPETRVPLTDTDIRSLDDVEARLEDEEHRYLVCVADQREATDETSGEAASSVADQREATDETGDDPERAGGVAFSHVGSGDSGNLTYWVAPEHRGNGYVTEATALLLDYAFRECGFHKVTGNAFVSNEASVAVLENLGFEREGRLRESGIVDGEYEDMYQYSILADEWLQGDEPNRPSPSS